MFIKKYWRPLSVFLVVVVSVGLYLQATHPPPEPIKIYKAVEPLEKPTQAPTTQTLVGEKPSQTPVGEKTEQAGHSHADGTWHAGSHDPVEMPPATGSKLPAPTAGNVDSPLTESEIKSLYRQLGREIAEMSPEEYDSSPADLLSRYSQKQLNYLLNRGINVDLLPPDVQKIVEDHMWRQQGVEPPPPGYTYLQKEDGTYFLHKEGEPLILDVHTDAQGNVTGGSFSYMGSANGRDIDEITREVARKAMERAETMHER